MNKALQTYCSELNLKTLGLCLVFLFNAYFLYAQSSILDSEVDEILQYVDSIKSVELIKGSHAHHTFHKYRKNKILWHKPTGGSYLEVFNMDNHKMAMVEYTGGNDDLYFYENYYYKNDTLVYSEIKQNFWKEQKKIWQATYLILKDSVLLETSINYSDEDVDYINEFAKRAKKLKANLKNL
ncbi:hypothetical protein [Nonlabens ponticola]|uniref:Uncharacterized protein n=1 Tax=Nonlabens ponticola TaxID=2496866 RepID=A0A3S9MWY6_9FLAO|nr:hypothetical protein [Nonlabens ponticola]AZQ43639.1 hypothetical protein EJ995_05100 [Nonlabens ponticola]